MSHCRVISLALRASMLCRELTDHDRPTASKQYKLSACGSFHVKSTQVTNRLPQNWMISCEIVVPMEISIAAKFHWFMATRVLRADIQSCQKTSFLARSCLWKSGITSTLIELQSSFYAHFKANKMPFPTTYYTNTFSTVVFKVFKFDLWLCISQNAVFWFFLNILCAWNYYLKHLQISNWDCNGIGFCEAVYCEGSLHLYWWGNFKQHVS
jgi:hypothetical protein